MNCRTVQDLTSAYLEEEVTAEERHGVDAHLRACGDCSTALFQASRVMSLVHRLPRVEPSAEFTDVVLARAREARLHERTGAASVWQRFLPSPIGLPAFRVPTLVWTPALVAASMLLALTGVHLGLLPDVAAHHAASPVVTASSAPVSSPANSPLSRDLARRAATDAPAPAVEHQTVASLSSRPRRSHHGTTRAVEAQAPATVVAQNPLGATEAYGADGLALPGRPVSGDPSAEMDLVLERVSADQTGFLQRTGTATPQTVHPKRRPRTF